MIKKLFVILLCLGSFIGNAQGTSGEPAMADAFRQEGKIYVVIAVMATVFLAVLLYLIMIERRLKKLEKELENKK